MSRSLVSNIRLIAIVVISIFGGLLKAHAADNQLSIENLILLPGETAKIAVDLSNSDLCYGLQFDISLPQGLTLTGVDKTTRTGDCVLTPNLNAGKERVVLLSLSNALAGNSGAICELNVKASDSFIGGNLKISNIKMSNGGTSDIVLSDVQNSFSTFRSAALTMSGGSIIAGESADVHVGLNSVGNVAGLQFDLYLPASLTVDLNSFALSADVSGFTIDKHQNSEFVRVLIYSLNRSVLSGDISDLLSFTIKANEGVQGASQIKLQSVAASTQSGVSVPLNDISADFTITPKVTSISLSPISAILKVSEEEQFSATVLPTNAADKSVSWSVSDSNVVTVDENGLVHAVGLGTATVTATSNENPDVSSTAQITVIETPAETITLNKTEATLKATETVDLVATILPETTTDKSVTWESSDEAIATVDANGKVTAVAVGKATITATAASSISATCEITVIETPAETISLNESEVSLEVSETVDLVATILPETTTDKSVTWESSDEAIATVDANGKVTAVAVGKATITATAASSISATCEITVIETPAETISLNESEVSLEVSETVDLVATILPETTTDKSITWESSDEAIATVDANGKVTAIAVGKATITATAASGISATCEIIVKAPSGINSPIYSEDADSMDNEMVFTLNGLFVAKTTDNLLPGVYIVKSVSGGVLSIKKIIIK